MPITRKLFWIIFSILLLTSCSPEKKSVSTADMNILFISVEDWTTNAIGCYGNDMVKTPNVDMLAEKGILFNHAYSQATVCNPSRASFTTGYRPDKTKIYHNTDHFDEHIPPELPFIAGVLGQHGAHTAQTGKLMHKWRYAFSVIDQFDQVEMEKPFATNDGEIIDMEPERGPFSGIVKYLDVVETVVPKPPKRSWTWVPDPHHDSILCMLDSIKRAKLASGEPDSWPLRKPFQQYHAEMTGDVGYDAMHTEDGVCTALGVKMIGDFAAEGRQFFLNVGLYAPHTPLLVPKKYVEMYDPAEMEISPITADQDVNIPMIAKRNGNNYDIFNGLYPQFAPTPENQRRAIAAYYGASSFMDDEIGKLLNALEKNGIADNTIVILFADHGFHLGEHGLWSKYTLFEESTHVPLIVYVPGAKGNGTASDALVELVDLLPTMCDLWEIEKDPGYEGLSFEPLLENPEQEWKKAVFSMLPRPLNARSVRTENFRYTEYRNNMDLPLDDQLVAVELYDLEKDPHEQINQAGKADYIKIQEDMKTLLHEGWQGGLPN